MWRTMWYTFLIYVFRHVFRCLICLHFLSIRIAFFIHKNINSVSILYLFIVCIRYPQFRIIFYSKWRNCRYFSLLLSDGRFGNRLMVIHILALSLVPTMLKIHAMTGNLILVECSILTFNGQDGRIEDLKTMMQMNTNQCKDANEYE